MSQRVMALWAALATVAVVAGVGAAFLVSRGQTYEDEGPDLISSSPAVASEDQKPVAAGRVQGGGTEVLASGSPATIAGAILTPPQRRRGHTLADDSGPARHSASTRNVRIVATPVKLEHPKYPPELVAAIPDLGKKLGKDDIRPIYDPVMVTVQESPMLDSDFVLGLEINGEAHAYPIRLLNGREMVNDVVGGVPILATW